MHEGCPLCVEWNFAPSFLSSFLLTPCGSDVGNSTFENTVALVDITHSSAPSKRPCSLNENFCL